MIIPCYNAAVFVGEAVGSALAQTHSPIEIIVINDGSPDTEDLERALEPFRSRLRYVKQANAGIAGARNTGLREARGEFVGFLDADDLWEPSFVATQLEWLTQPPGADLVYCNATLFGPDAPSDKAAMDLSPSNGEANLESVLEWKCIVLTSGVLARLDTVRRAGGFDPARRLCEDFDLWVRMLLQNAKFTYHKGRLFRRRLHRASLSRDPLAMVESAMMILEDVLRLNGLPDAAAMAARRNLGRLEYEHELAQGRRFVIEGKARPAAGHLWSAARKARRVRLGLVASGLWMIPSIVLPLVRKRVSGAHSSEGDSLPRSGDRDI